jgi:hypothetical protein
MISNNVYYIKNHIWWILKYFLTAKESIIHCHLADWRIRAIIGFMSLTGKKTVISIHGDSLKNSLVNTSWVKKKIIGFSLKRASFVIALNSKIRDLCLKLGVKPNRVKVIPSFIPPLILEGECNLIPSELWFFIKNHSPIISANASSIRVDEKGDTYGLNMCIESCIRLKKEYPKLGLIFCISKIEDFDYYSKIKDKIKKNEINENLFLLVGDYPFYPILKKSDIFVRPTTTDGDAISLREALYLKIPALASNVISRPRGTKLFSAGDISEMTIGIKRIFENYKIYKKKVEEISYIDYSQQIISIYKKLLSE